MKITISKQGVDFELEGDEILKALFDQGNKALYELKRALDKLEFDEFKGPDISDDCQLTEEEVNDILGLPYSLNKPAINEEKLPSDIKTSLSPQKSNTLNKTRSKPKKININPVTGKRRYHPRKKRDIANNAEKRKFETNAPGKITGKNYRTAENNPFL